MTNSRRPERGEVRYRRQASSVVRPATDELEAPGRVERLVEPSTRGVCGACAERRKLLALRRPYSLAFVALDPSSVKPGHA